MATTVSQSAYLLLPIIVQVLNSQRAATIQDGICTKRWQHQYITIINNDDNNNNNNNKTN
jgi:hypothetical protein